MANVNRPTGLTPVKYLNGADWDGRGNVYEIGTANTDIIRIGDPVTKDLTLANCDTTSGLMAVKLAASTNMIVGVVLAVGTQYNGPYVDPRDLTKNYAPATKAVPYYALVADDPNIIYEIQEEKGTTQMSTAYVGCNQILVADTPATTLAAGQTISAYQVACVTTGTPAATATFDFKLIGLSQRYDSITTKNAYGAYAKWLVKLNLPFWANTTGFAAAS